MIVMYIYIYIYQAGQRAKEIPHKTDILLIFGKTVRKLILTGIGL